mmetsp:Transcript_20/g.70  ORF Transcript_20/g.70 Transcript_20/m.70 type:complete len:354 (+) Transcript_20:311-1372(+)
MGLNTRALRCPTDEWLLRVGRERWQIQGEYVACSLDELRKQCREKGMASSGNRFDVVERLLTHASGGDVKKIVERAPITTPMALAKVKEAILVVAFRKSTGKFSMQRYKHHYTDVLQKGVQIIEKECFEKQLSSTKNSLDVCRVVTCAVYSNLEPVITGRGYGYDYEFFEIMKKVLKAQLAEGGSLFDDEEDRIDECEWLIAPPASGSLLLWRATRSTMTARRSMAWSSWWSRKRTRGQRDTFLILRVWWTLRSRPLSDLGGLDCENNKRVFKEFFTRFPLRCLRVTSIIFPCSSSFCSHHRSNRPPFFRALHRHHHFLPMLHHHPHLLPLHNALPRYPTHASRTYLECFAKS